MIQSIAICIFLITLLNKNPLKPTGSREENKYTRKPEFKFSSSLSQECSDNRNNTGCGFNSKPYVDHQDTFRSKQFSGNKGYSSSQPDTGVVNTIGRRIFSGGSDSSAGCLLYTSRCV